jgi:hypothetical protein
MMGGILGRSTRRRFSLAWGGFSFSSGRPDHTAIKKKQQSVFERFTVFQKAIHHRWLALMHGSGNGHRNDR